jgi:hypothetical protein
MVARDSFAGCPFGTEPRRSISSKPGPLQTETRLMFSLPVFFRLIHVLVGMTTNAPGWRRTR